MMPLQLSYDVPPECPDEAAFVEGVRSRLPEGFDTNDPSGAVGVRVVRAPDGYRALVDVPAAGGQRTTRVVEGKSCENVVRGSALVTALALEARVIEAAETAEAPPASETPDAEAPAPPRPAPVATAPPPPRAASTPPPARARRSEADLRNRSDGALAFSAGVRGSLATGMAPTPAFGAGVFVGVRYRAFGAGVTLERVRSGAVRSAGVRAEYGLDSARLEAGLSLPLASSLELEGLATFEGGVLGAEALPEPPTVVDGTRGTVAWLSPGAAARLRVLGGPVFVSGELFARAPLVQERFFVDLDGTPRVVHRVAFFSVGGALVVGARF